MTHTVITHYICFSFQISKTMHHHALHTAIQQGDLPKLEELIRSGLSINHLFGMKGTPLCAAVAAGKTHIVEYLIDYGCDVNAKDYDGEPPLCMAIRKGFRSLAEILITNGKIDLDKTDPITGDHPLIIAILKDDLHSARLLVQYGCNVNKRKRDENKTALHVAVATDNLEFVTLLLNHGAALTLVSRNGVNPFLYATNLNSNDIVEYILEHTNTMDVNVDSELDKLGGAYHTMTEYLLHHTSQIQQDTALHMAARNGNAKLTQLFLKLGARINERNTFGHTPLFLACSEPHKGHLPVVNILLSDASLDTEVLCYNKDGSSPVRQRDCRALHVAISRGCLGIVEALIQAGTSVNQQDSMGVTPLAYAFLCDKLVIADYIIKHCPDLDVHLQTTTGENLLWPALTCKEPQKFVECLLERGCCVNHENDSGESPIHAALDASLAAMGVLAQNGANLDAIYNDSSPLHICATDHLIDESCVLIYYGADMNCRNTSGQSVLEMALTYENFNLDIVSMMLDCGCDVRTERGLWEVINQQDDDEDIPWCQQEDPKIYDRIMQAISNPLSLKFGCRNAIRLYFRDHHVFMGCIDQLPLPKGLIHFVQLTDARTKTSLQVL